jgi:hypothetical protein
MMKAAHKKIQGYMTRIAHEKTEKQQEKTAGFYPTALEIKYLSSAEMEELRVSKGSPGDYIAYRLGGLAALKNRALVW